MTTIVTEQLAQIQSVIDSSSTPLSRQEILETLDVKISPKTLQRRLVLLIERKSVVMEGTQRWARYRSANIAKREPRQSFGGTQSASESSSIFSEDALRRLAALETPSFARPPVSYNFDFMESYIPNVTRYVPTEMSERLHGVGLRFNKALAAGTYAKNIVERLLIDLSFNSSRLEGNTYSILDTEKLVNQGVEADGKLSDETIMILNHKEAILFLINNAEEITPSPFVIRNLHMVLSQDLLQDPNESGVVRHREVSITKTSYTPLGAPQQLEEAYILMLRKAEKIKDPFEQSFFLLMHLSYLQAFIDVNKRTARLSCNLPFIQLNLCPLSFIDVPREDYLRALILFYETNDYLPALELFAWAYERSSAKYEVVEQSIGRIDSYRIKYRAQRKEIMGTIVRNGIVGEAITDALEHYCNETYIPDKDKFVAMTTVELKRLHSGALVAIGVTESMFERWKAKQDKTLRHH